MAGAKEARLVKELERKDSILGEMQSKVEEQAARLNEAAARLETGQQESLRFGEEIDGMNKKIEGLNAELETREQAHTEERAVLNKAVCATVIMLLREGEGPGGREGQAGGQGERAERDGPAGAG